MTKPISFDDLKLLDFKNSDGEPIWFYMNRIFFMYHYPKLFNDEEIKEVISRDSNKLNAFKCLSKMVFHNIKWITNNQKKDIIFYVPSRNNKTDGKFLNQYSDYFAMLYHKKTLTLENAPTDWTYNMPRKNEEVIFYGPNLAFSLILAKYKKKETKNVKALIEYINNKCIECLEKGFTDSQKQELLNATIKEMEKIRIHAKWLLKICKKHKTNLFIMVGGSYQYYYAINRLLKSNNIKTADLQHGYILKNSMYHIGFEELLKKEELKIATPNYLLTYGKYWSDQSNLPYDQKVEIGNPYRDIKIANFNHDKKREKILLIGCMHETIKYIELANKLQEMLPKYQVIFRPHPIERIYTKELSQKIELKCSLDVDKDLYQQLEETKVVISEISTVLYESEGLVDHIVAWRTPYGKGCMSECSFETFENVEDLIKIINSPSNIKINKIFYIDDYQRRYRELIEKVIN